MADRVTAAAELRKRRTRANNNNSNRNNCSASAVPSPYSPVKQQSTKAAAAVAVSSTTTDAADRRAAIVTADAADDTSYSEENSCPTVKPHRSTSSSNSSDEHNGNEDINAFRLHIHFDPMSWLLFVLACATRVYRLAEPNHIVFDELHYGRYVSLYMRRTFFFDQHPPLGKQLIAGMAWLSGYDGNFTFSRIGAEYSSVGGGDSLQRVFEC